MTIFLVEQALLSRGSEFRKMDYSEVFLVNNKLLPNIFDASYVSTIVYGVAGQDYGSLLLPSKFCYSDVFLFILLKYSAYLCFHISPKCYHLYDG